MEYSIGVAAEMTGLPVDTLRAWERRYGVPKPTRHRGRRAYGDEEIARLRLVAEALAAGHRTGDVVALPVRELERLVLGQNEGAAGDRPATPFRCLQALVRHQASQLDDELRRASLLYGPVRFVTEVAHPLAERVGRMWERGELDVHQEHLFTASLSTQLRVLMATLEGGSRSPVIVLTTLPGELHALGLEMTAVLLSARGAAPRLLGANCPPTQIAAAAAAYGANIVGISVSPAAPRAETERNLAELVGATPCPIWLGGAGAARLRDFGDRVRVISTPRTLEEELERVRKATIA